MQISASAAQVSSSKTPISSGKGIPGSSLFSPWAMIYSRSCGKGARRTYGLLEIGSDGVTTQIREVQNGI